ncbi:FUSC family protein [Rhodopila sp.]|uniref:FUSC family protein n=1 Tax=Rhodopila sp. TaxID=2480087 RepID=UPI003D10AC38
MNPWPGSNEWLFSVKTFAAAMLALYIAMSIGLDRPYWAMATVYIVSQPLIGSVRSKAIFRLVGTAIGAIATIVLVPNLVDAPELLSAALALWTGGCLYIALLDRTPRSYLFMLAGYTAALIGFPAVNAPDTIWDVALARVEEIWLGILCSTVIATVVFPRQLGPLLAERILAWVGNASTWTQQVLDGTDDKANAFAHLRLAADAVELRMLTSQLAWDDSIWQSATRWVGELQRRMVLLLPVLSSISDRLAALRAADAITPGLRHLLADLSVWVRAGAPPPRGEADRMRHAIEQLQAETDLTAGWNQVMRCSLLLRLHDLVNLRQDMRDLRRHIEEGGGPLALPLAVPSSGPQRLHHDQGLAVLSGLAAAVTIVLACAFWIATGWQAGSGMAALAAAACCLFATLDDPTPALKNFLVIALISVAAVGIGLFAILPNVHDFEMLALVLAAFFIPVGLLIARPATQPMGSALGFLTATLLSLQGAYSADFVSYADGSFAALLGVASAAVVTALMRSVGAEWSARRLLRADWRDLAAIPTSPTLHDQALHDRDTMAGLLLDRLGLLVPRLAAVGAGNDLAAVDALADLRIGINLADLRNQRDVMTSPLRQAVDTVLHGVAAHFAAQAAAGRQLRLPATVLRDIDCALDAAIADADARDLLLQLVGLRRGLFADAPPYRPPPFPHQPPPDAAAAPDPTQRPA